MNEHLRLVKDAYWWLVGERGGQLATICDAKSMAGHTLYGQALTMQTFAGPVQYTIDEHLKA